MSYNRAWDLIDEINRAFSKAAVASQTGGKQGGGARLTPFGKLLVQSYRRSERVAADTAELTLQFSASKSGLQSNYLKSRHALPKSNAFCAIMIVD